MRSFFTNWLAGKKLSTAPNTYAHYKKAVTKFLETLGERTHKSLSTVNPGDVAAFRDVRLKQDRISTGTLVLDLKTIRSVFSSARRQGLLLHNPAEAVDLPINRPIERDLFTAEELRALLGVASEERRTLILCGYYLGGRLGDMVRLGWDSVDLAGGVIFYTQGKTQRKVEVPIHPELEQRLSEIAGDQRGGPLCQTLVEARIDGRDGLSNQFARLLTEAGISAETVQADKNHFSRKRFHSLRHSFASALANSGVSPELRMKLTGHKSVDVHRRYTHMEPTPTSPRL